MELSSTKTTNPSQISIFYNAMVVTMDSELRVFENGAIVIQGDIIKEIGKSDDVIQRYHESSFSLHNLNGQFLLPGFVNTHVHTSQQLGRGIADDVDLMTWLHHRIWPYESHMTEEDSFISTLLCGIELIHSGHVAEIPYENQVVMDTRKVDHGTVTFLEKIKFLQSNLLAAHSVWVNDDEIGYLARAQVKVSHCPAAAMRMLGFAPIRKMMNAGVCVSLGTDGAPSNNRMSIVDEMYLASLINKGHEVFVSGTTDPTALPAELVLKMGTIDGAKTVLWDNEIGSLEVGKKADFVIVDPCSWTMAPVHDSISSLVYSMRTENIVSVICNGKWIMKDKKILTIDEGEIILQAQNASKQLLERAGISIPKRMHMI